MNLDAELRRQGLFIRGVTRLEAAEIEIYGFPADKPMLALVGNIGSSYWPQFEQSAEFHDGLAHPLDRWSRRLAESLQAIFPIIPLYPFAGPPYFPFQRWAQRAEALEQSPLGIMMHPLYGLWHSYRFALLAADFEVTANPPMPASHCLECSDKPCLQRCPVEAFDGQGYAVDRCAGYLSQTPRATCHAQGCLARHACPIAPELAYTHAQGQFHLRAFLKARE